MNLGGESSSPRLVRSDSARAYLLDMIEQLAQLSRRSDEAELAILLKAILDASRVAKRASRVKSSG